MTAIIDRLDAATRRRLLERLAELRAVERLIRQVSEQRPPDPQPALAAITTKRED